MERLLAVDPGGVYTGWVKFEYGEPTELGTFKESSDGFHSPGELSLIKEQIENWSDQLLNGATTVVFEGGVHNGFNLKNPAVEEGGIASKTLFYMAKDQGIDVVCLKPVNIYSYFLNSVGKTGNSSHSLNYRLRKILNVRHDFKKNLTRHEVSALGVGYAFFDLMETLVGLPNLKNGVSHNGHNGH